MKNTATLLITCPDTKGIVAAIADFLYQHNANILHADQHQDAENSLFLMRVEWDLKDFSLDEASFAKAFEVIAKTYKMTWELKLSKDKPRMAQIFYINIMQIFCMLINTKMLRIASFLCVSNGT